MIWKKQFYFWAIIYLDQFKLKIFDILREKFYVGHSTWKILCLQCTRSSLPPTSTSLNMKISLTPVDSVEIFSYICSWNIDQWNCVFLFVSSFFRFIQKYNAKEITKVAASTTIQIDIMFQFHRLSSASHNVLYIK